MYDYQEAFLLSIVSLSFSQAADESRINCLPTEIKERT